MNELHGKRIGIAADRKAEAIAEIITKKGGKPVIQSIQGKKILNEQEAEDDVNYLLTNAFDWIVLTTGIGSEALEQAAIRLNCLDPFIDRLRQSKLAIRGSKTVKWLKKSDLTPTLLSPDGTMEKLVNLLHQEDLKDKEVFFQAYNKEEQQLANQLRELPIKKLYHSLPYYYVAPDEKIVEELQTQIFNKTIDAVIFTSKTQVQNLFINREKQQDLISALQHDVLAVSIGKVTTNELIKNGVKRVLEPESPKFGAMIIELADYYS